MARKWTASISKRRGGAGPPLVSTFVHNGHGLFTWTLDRRNTALAPGAADFDGVGPAIGFHHPDWSFWRREDDPSWDDWGTSYQKTSRIPVFDQQGGLISAWTCPVATTDFEGATMPPPVFARVDQAHPAIVDGMRAQLTLVPEGGWS